MLVLQVDVNDDPTPLPSSRFLDATDDAFPSDEDHVLDIDMEQRGIDYTGTIAIRVVYCTSVVYSSLFQCSAVVLSVVFFDFRVATPEID